MANDLLDPKIDDGQQGENFDPNIDFSAKDWNDKVNAANTPADYAAQDQRDAAIRNNNDIPYSPDPTRRNLAASEGSGRTSRTPQLGGSDEDTALKPLAKDDDIEKPKNKRGRIKGFLGNRYAQGGVLSGGIIGVLISGFIGFTPFQLLHIANLLQDWHFWDDDQTGNWSTRRILNTVKGQRQFNNLGIVSNVFANRYESRLRQTGIEFDYKDNNGRSRSSVQGIIIDRDNPKQEAAISKAIAEGILDGNSIPDSGKHRVGVRGRSGTKLARSLSSILINDGLGMNKISAALPKRLLRVRMGVNFRPLNPIRDRTQDRSDAKRAARERRAQEVKDGVDSDTHGNRGDRRPADDEGNKSDRNIDNDTRSGADDYIDDILDAKDDPPSIDKKTRIKNLTGKLIPKGAAGPTAAAVAVVGLVCAAQDIGEASEEVQYAQTILPMARLAMQVVTAAGQMTIGSESGDIDAEAIAEISETFYDIQAEEGAESFFAARPVQAEMGKEPNGPDIPDSAKPGELGEEPAFLALINMIPGIGGLCGANDWINDRIGSIPGVSHVSDFLENRLDDIARLSTGKDIETWTFALLSWIAGEGVDALATGAELGALSAYGAKLASNDAMMAQGGSELSNTQTTQWKNIQRETMLAERKHQSLYTRILDLRNPHSLSAIALLETPVTTSPVAFVNTIRKRPASVFSGLRESVARIMTPHAYAQQSYDYGFSDFGFGPEVLNDDLYSNPFCNAAYVTGSTCVGDESDIDYPVSGASTSSDGDGTVTVEYSESKLPDFNDSWGKCFGNPIDDDGNVTTEPQVSYKDVMSDDCSNASGEDFNRYRLFLLDRMNAAALSCYENIFESSCQEVGLSGGGNNDSTGLGGPLPEGVAGPEDVGTTSGCGGIQVHKSWLAVVEEMCTAAAADGLNLTGGGWRDYQQQVEHRKDHCGTSHYDIYEKPSSQCSPPTARPGSSNHEKGLAIDFDNCSSQGTRCHQWLKNYAHPQIVNLPSEPWHWSVNGG